MDGNTTFCPGMREHVDIRLNIIELIYQKTENLCPESCAFMAMTLNIKNVECMIIL